MCFLERSTRIILLIEDDEFDRAALTRMLEASGYGVMATTRRAAVDAFAINRPWIALILASTSLTDAERIRLLQALHRIDQYVPVVVGARRPLYRPNSGQDSVRHEAFVALIAEVGRRLDVASAQAAAQVESFARVQAPAPAPASASEDFVFAHDISAGQALPPRTTGAGDRDGVFFPDFSELPPPQWHGSSRLTSFANLDPRSYFHRVGSARRSRRKRIRNIGIAIAAACSAPLIVPPLVQLRPTIARAIAEAGPTEMPPLASADISARIGIVPLVSSARVQRSSVANAIVLPAKADADDVEQRSAQRKPSRDADRSRRSRQR